MRPGHLSFCHQVARDIIQQMPSPVGHILAGLAIGSFTSRDRSWSLPVACAAAAVLPDIDFLLPVAHRGPTHSIAAALAAAAVTFLLVSFQGKDFSRFRVATAIGLAVLSHVLLDWLGQDSSSPRGLMAFWPLTSTYFVSDLNIFNAVDRRYWLPGFWRRNTIAVLREIAILLPIAWLSMSRSRGRSSARGGPPRPFASAGDTDGT